MTSAGTPAPPAAITVNGTGDTLPTALALHRAGEFERAAALYGRIIENQPRNSGALYLMAVLAGQTGDHTRAIDLLNRAIGIDAGVAAYHSKIGDALAATGRSREAVVAYRRGVAIDPDDAMAHTALGHAHLDRSEFDDAAEAYGRAADLRPDAPEAHNNLGNALRNLGRPDEAAAAYRRAIEIRPDYAMAHDNLGNALRDQDRLDEAVDMHHRAIALDPGYASAYSNLGNALAAQDRLDEAIGAYRQAVAVDPNFAKAYKNLGTVLDEKGDRDGAIAAYRSAIEQNPGFADAFSSLGNALREKDRLDEALRAHLRAIELDPGSPVAHNDLAYTLRLQGKPAEAADAHRRAIALKPDFVQAHNSLGCVLVIASAPDEAVAALRRAIEIDPDHAMAHNNLGLALMDLGTHSEAATEFRRALEIDAALAEAHSNLLYCLYHDSGVSVAGFLAEARRWDAVHAAPLAGRARPHVNDPDPNRRLRVGYVSPDFRQHATMYLVEPLLAHHDARAVELFCYAEVARPDAVTGRYRELADHWRPTVGMTHSAVADLIREDRIDILVDLAGHTANHRLLTFAERPAPVQVGHPIGFGQTTGMAAIDYVLTDASLTPEEHESGFGETPWRLPRCCLGFRPSPDWPELSPLPAKRRGHVTFAAFGNPSRITPATVALWSRALRAVPGATLMLKHRLLGNAAVRERLRAGFDAQGLAGRVEFHDLAHGWAAEMDIYESVDIALDSFPLGGGTTTCIALWMGLPVVMLGSAETHNRVGIDYLGAIGLDDGVATDADDFARRTAALAGDIDALAERRAGLRQRMRASPLLDHRGLAAATEEAYRGMWRKWCARQGTAGLA